MHPRFESLEPGWETALVAFLTPDNSTAGVVWLNKVLAALQREGFPVPMRFSNLPMGPASLDAEGRARRAVERGLLAADETPLRDSSKSARRDYHLTSRGRDYVQQVVLPTIDSTAFSAEYQAILHETVRRAVRSGYARLVRESHDDLVLDDPEGFEEQYDQVIADLERILEFFGDDRPPALWEEEVLATAASIALGAMRTARPGVSRLLDNSTGKHHIFANARDLIDLIGGPPVERSWTLPGGDGIGGEIARRYIAILENARAYDLTAASYPDEQAAFIESG